MPYYIFRIKSSDGLELVKQLELIDTFDSFREAKVSARRLRAEAGDDETPIKVMFADNRLAAEEQLLEKRERPVLMEHER